MTEFERFILNLKVSKGIEVCHECGKPLHKGYNFHGVTYCQEHKPVGSKAEKFNWEYELSDKQLEGIIRRCKNSKIDNVKMMRKLTIAVCNKRRQKKIVKNHISVAFNPLNEEEKKLFEYASSKNNMAGYLKGLIKADMKNKH